MLRAPLLHFLLLGGLLYAFQSIGSDAEEIPVVEVQRSAIEERLEVYRNQMGRPPSPAEARSIEKQVVDEALWLQQAFAIGLHEVDSVVRQRLLLNMRFLEGQDADASESELIERAIELGMDRSDTVVQRRLIDRVQAILRAGVRANPPDAPALRAHYEETAERWREPPLLDLSHVYLSRDRRGEATRDDARRLLGRVEGQALDPEAAIALGDPFLAGHRLRGASPNRIVARLGPRFAAGVAEGPPEAWFGPVESAFGQHLVWIHARVESRIPPLDEIRARVLEDWIEGESRRVLREYIDRRRTRVEVRILDDVGGPDAAAAPSEGPAAG
ncbi:MAG: peptidylprolyl isomerase [Myxococcota bacterium]